MSVEVIAKTRRVIEDVKSHSAGVHGDAISATLLVWSIDGLNQTEERREDRDS